MAFSIKDEETDRLARQLAERRGVSLTEAVRMAVRAELQQEARAQEKRRKERRIRLGNILKKMDKIPVHGHRSADDILGYNERGLWD